MSARWMTSILLFLLFLLATFAHTANAQVCPSPYDTDPCNDECELLPNGYGGQYQIYCDFTDETASVEAHAVTDYDDNYGTPNYSIFGETPSGGEFCCWFDDPDNEVTLVFLDGTDEDDFLECNWDAQNLYYLAGGQDFDFLACRIDGHEGQDLIDGSDDDQGEINLLLGCLHDECDYLTGNAHVDHIHAFAGGDWLAGGGHGDTMYGDEGDDILFGDGGNDTMHGGPGDDLMTGEAGYDVVDGGPGTDQLLGGDDNDILCGGGGTGDSFDGEGGSNILWAPRYISTSPTGSSGSTDHCGNTDAGFGSWAGGSCNYDLDTSDKPDECD